MSDLDIEIRETYGIPDGIDTITWCERNGVDYIMALHEAVDRYFEGRKSGG
jgi:hypothetical protein